jgi:LytS/YehU family sensor histidine kinase
MNTLNNIHALIRSNPEKAEDAIVGFSKIMRYLLYESNLEKVSMEKEFVLIRNYIDLMRLLLTDHVKINLELPFIFPTVNIPPLIYITFLENAFKHGISYSKDSYINFKITYDDHFVYSTIQNSNHHVKSDSASGIGLDNVKKRLNLIYGKKYKIKITEKPEEFRVELQIPISI